MRLVVTRDSVAAGDDVDAPHLEEMDAPVGSDASEAVLLITRTGYLPPISGGRATWSIVSNLPIAVIAQQWSEPRMLSSIPEKLGNLKHEGDALRLHVNYHAQQDPEVVFEVLRRLNRHGF